MAGNFIVLRRFGDEVSAQIAAIALESNGVPAIVSADTAGGALPNMAVLFPVRLLVRAEDESLARELLDTPVEGAVEDDVAEE